MATKPLATKTPSVPLGTIKPVTNKNPKPAANELYYAALLRTGDTVDAFLFTAKDLQRASTRADKNREDVPVRSWIKQLKEVFI